MHTMHTSHSSTEAIIVMFAAMIIASLIAGMNLFVDKLSDIRLNINDLYMGITMSGIMFIVMGIFYRTAKLLSVGVLIFAIGVILSRTQAFVSPKIYIQSMIPHHSMAVLMSKQLLNNYKPSKTLTNLANSIITSQESEIELMKKM